MLHTLRRIENYYHGRITFTLGMGASIIMDVKIEWSMIFKSVKIRFSKILDCWNLRWEVRVSRDFWFCSIVHDVHTFEIYWKVRVVIWLKYVWKHTLTFILDCGRRNKTKEILIYCLLQLNLFENRKIEVANSGIFITSLNYISDHKANPYYRLFSMKSTLY